MTFRLSEAAHKFFKPGNRWQGDIDRQLASRIRSDGGESPAGLVAPRAVSIDTIVNHVAGSSVLLLPATIEGEALSALQREFRALIDEADDSGFMVNRHDGATNIRVIRMQLDESAFPATAAFFSSRVLRNVTTRYFHSEAFTLNDEIFVHETPPTSDPLSGALHYDKRHTLKYWIYIDDLPVEAGPMRIAPQSAPANRRLRAGAVTDAASYGEIVNIANEDVTATPLAGPAGTVLIHDTDAYHGASPVMPGHVRRIMRGHCRSESERAIIRAMTKD